MLDAFVQAVQWPAVGLSQIQSRVWVTAPVRFVGQLAERDSVLGAQTQLLVSVVEVVFAGHVVTVRVV